MARLIVVWCCLRSIVVARDPEDTASSRVGAHGARGRESTGGRDTTQAGTTAQNAEASARARRFIDGASRGLPAHPRCRNGSFAPAYELEPERHGVVFAAVGVSSIRKATVSAASVRALSKRVGTILVTGDAGLEMTSGTHYWDHVVSLDGHGIELSDLPEFEAFTQKRDKSAAVQGGREEAEKERVANKPGSWAVVRQLRSLKMTAMLVALKLFDKAVFLDADTSVCAPLDAAFDSVDDVTWFAFVPAPATHHGALLERMYGITRHNSPPEPNSGVVAVARTEGARRTLRRWSAVYWRESLALGSIQNPMDQPPLRAAMYLENATWVALESHMNCRGHVHGLNAHLPMRCGGFEETHWEDLTRSLALATPTAFRASPEALKAARRLRGGAGCAVLHSHSLPRVGHDPEIPIIANLRLTQNTLKLYNTNGSERRSSLLALFSEHKQEDEEPLPGAVQVLGDEVAVALVEVGAGNIEQQQEEEDGIVAGDYALERCAAVGRTACAVVVLLHDHPIVELILDFFRVDTSSSDFGRRLKAFAKARPARGETYLDKLLMLDPRTLDEQKPRQRRSEALGFPTTAELAQLLEKLPSEVALVLWAARPNKSMSLARSHLRPSGALAKIQASLQIRSQRQRQIAQDAAATLDEATVASLYTILELEIGLYSGLTRLFDAQLGPLGQTFDHLGHPNEEPS